MKHIKGKTFADVYHKAMIQIFEHPDYECAPRGQKIKECLNVALEIEDITSNLFKYEDKELTLPTGYLKREIALYLSTRTDAMSFAKASPFWDTIKNQDGTINSAYGNLIFNPSLADGRSQFDWAYDSLVADKDSRQAFMRYNNTSHQFNGNKDLPCTFIQIFHIRDNMLYSTVEMRSNDIVCGLTYDVPSFTLFQYMMFMKLKANAYPDLELGTYTHIANSMHVYERNFELIEKRLKADIIENCFPLPKTWKMVKSDDVNRLVEKRVLKSDIQIDNWEYPENEEFYNWILA